MKSCLLIFGILLCVNANAQSWQWGRRGGSDNAMSDTNWPEQVRSMATDLQGNVYILSPVGVANLDVDGHAKDSYSTFTSAGSPADYMIASFACDGTYRWSKVLGGDRADSVVKIQTDAEGNVYAAGNFYPVYTGQNAVHIDTDLTLPVSAYSSNTYKQSLFIIKFNSLGELQWLRMPQRDNISWAEGAQQGRTLAMEVDAAGNSFWIAYLSADTYANGAYTVPVGGYHVLRYDAAGVFVGGFPLDMHLQGYVSTYMKVARNATTGVIYFTAPFSSTGGDVASFGGQSVTHEYFLAAYDASGQFLWKKESTVSPLSGSGFKDISLDSNGDIYLCGGAANGMTFAGHTITSSSPSITPIILKLDAAGDLIWGSNAVSTAAGEANTIVKGAVAGGFGAMTWNNISVSVPFNTGYDIYMARFDPATGSVTNIETLQDDDGYADYGTALARDDNNNFYLGGKFGHLLYVNNAVPMVNENQQTDFFVAKFGSSDCTLGVGETESEFKLLKVWPNPAFDEIYVNTDKDMHYRIFDLQGKLLLEGELQQKSIDIAPLAKGMYLLQVHNENDEMRTFKFLKE